MSNIDRQRIVAVRTMEALGYAFDGVEWSASAPAGAQLLAAEADAMHAVLVLRADALDGCAEGSPEEQELGLIAEVIADYETKRWPDGKIAGGKG